MDSVPNGIGAADFIEVMAQGSPGAGVGRGTGLPGEFLDALVHNLQHNPRVPDWLRRGKGGSKGDVPAALLSALRQATTRPEREPRSKPERPPEPEPSPRPEPPQPREAADTAEQPPAEVATAPALDRAESAGADEASSTRPETHGEAKAEASSETGLSEKAGERTDGTVEAQSSATHAKPAESSQGADGRPEPVPESAGPAKGVPGEVVEPDAARAFRIPPEALADAPQPAEGGDDAPAEPRAQVPLELPPEDLGSTKALVEESPDGLAPSSASMGSDAVPEPKAAEAGPQNVPLEQPPPPTAHDSAAQETADMQPEPRALNTAPAANEEVPEEAQPPSRESSAANAPNTGHMPLDQPALRPEAGHGAQPAAGEGVARGLALASAEAEDGLLRAVGPRVTSAAISLTASADAVGAIDASSGADGAGNGGGQIGPHASASSAATPSGGGAAEAEATEQLDAVFKQVLSTAALPRELRNRIELARSIGRQVIRGALVSVKDGRMQVELQLRPPTLGTVRMQLTTEGKALSAKLSVENGFVREVVEQHLSQLRSVLRDEGFSLERFDVSVRRDAGSESWASGHADDHGRDGARADATQHEEGYTDESDALLEVAASAASTHEGAVDYLA